MKQSEILESRLSTLTTDNKLEIKHTNDEVSYFIKNQSSQPEPMQNDTFWKTSFSTPINCKTPSLKY